jgi:DNA invertase Pin-like site-specific DNA recombinase
MIGNMKIGYARVSTYEQNLALQTDALEKVGCEKVFHDQITLVSPNTGVEKSG